MVVPAKTVLQGPTLTRRAPVNAQYVLLVQSLLHLLINVSYVILVTIILVEEGTANLVHQEHIPHPMEQHIAISVTVVMNQALPPLPLVVLNASQANILLREPVKIALVIPIQQMAGLVNVSIVDLEQKLSLLPASLPLRVSCALLELTVMTTVHAIHAHQELIATSLELIIAISARVVIVRSRQSEQIVTVAHVLLVLSQQLGGPANLVHWDMSPQSMEYANVLLVLQDMKQIQQRIPHVSHAPPEAFQPVAITVLFVPIILLLPVPDQLNAIVVVVDTRRC